MLRNFREFLSYIHLLPAQYRIHYHKLPTGRRTSNFRQQHLTMVMSMVDAVRNIPHIWRYVHTSHHSLFVWYPLIIPTSCIFHDYFTGTGVIALVRIMHLWQIWLDMQAERTMNSSYNQHKMPKITYAFAMGHTVQKLSVNAFGLVTPMATEIYVAIGSRSGFSLISPSRYLNHYCPINNEAYTWGQIRMRCSNYSSYIFENQ